MVARLQEPLFAQDMDSMGDVDLVLESSLVFDEEEGLVPVYCTQLWTEKKIYKYYFFLKSCTISLSTTFRVIISL